MADQPLVIINHSKGWKPATDAYETTNSYRIVIEMPGMRSGNFTVNLVKQRLVISGKRQHPTEELSTAYHQLEIQYGEFRTEIEMPGLVDRDNIVAAYDDGFLTVTLPRQQKTHTIPVISQKDNE